MEFIKKHKIWFALPLFLFLVLLFWPEGANNYDFGITYIASGHMASSDFEKLTGAITEAVKEELGEEAEINIEEMTTEFDEGSARQTAMARLLYGDGVIYIAEYELVRDIVDDDELFAPLPDELGADILNSASYPAAKSLQSFGGISLDGSYPELCIFIRSDVAEENGMAAYLKENYAAAVNVLLKLK